MIIITAGNVIIFGGTFDPIHIGHLVIADYIRDKIGFDKVYFIPSGNPPHKSLKSISSAEHRYNMVSLAIENNCYFEVLDVEIKKEGYSYTIDTIRELTNTKKLSNICLLCGADVIMDLTSWKEFKTLVGMCNFVSVMRPGCDREKYFEKINKLKELYSAKINVYDGPMIDISSSYIRKLIKERRTVRYLLPDNVIEYIKTNNLYL